MAKRAGEKKKESQKKYKKTADYLRKGPKKKT